GFQETLSGSSRLIAGVAEGIAIVMLAPAVAVRGWRVWHRPRGDASASQPPADAPDHQALRTR
ncbi:MAG: hypothetical protein ACM3ML_26465, partial [Micromonosporaceae bacterium]